METKTIVSCDNCKSKIKLEELPAGGDYNPMKVTVANVTQFYI